jgi:transposase
MTRKRRKFTREFKVEALRLVEESGKPLTQIARELGVRADLLYSWKRRSSKASNASISREWYSESGGGDSPAAPPPGGGRTGA